jgi:hypothetical protein
MDYREDVSVYEFRSFQITPIFHAQEDELGTSAADAAESGDSFEIGKDDAAAGGSKRRAWVELYLV